MPTDTERLDFLASRVHATIEEPGNDPGKVSLFCVHPGAGSHSEHTAATLREAIDAAMVAPERHTGSSSSSLDEP